MTAWKKLEIFPSRSTFKKGYALSLLMHIYVKPNIFDADASDMLTSSEIAEKQCDIYV